MQLAAHPRGGIPSLPFSFPPLSSPLSLSFFDPPPGRPLYFFLIQQSFSHSLSGRSAAARSDLFCCMRPCFPLHGSEQQFLRCSLDDG